MQAKSGWRRENQPEIHVGVVRRRRWSTRAGINVSRLILLIYLLPWRPTIRNCMRMRRIRPIREVEPEMEPARDAARVRKAERWGESTRERERGKEDDTARYRWKYRKMYTEQRDHNGSSTTIEFRR